MNLKGSNKVDKARKDLVMEMFRINNFNILKTSKESGIARNTLSHWLKAEKSKDESKIIEEQLPLSPEPISKKNKLPAINDLSNLKSSGIDLKNYEEIAKYVRINALNRILDLINKERNMNKLTNIVRALSDITLPPLPKSDNESIIATINNIQNNFVNSDEIIASLTKKYMKLN